MNTLICVKDKKKNCSVYTGVHSRQCDPKKRDKMGMWKKWGLIFFTGCLD